MDTPERTTVAGIFKDEGAAARALEALIEEHFDPESDVSVIVSHRHDRESVPVSANFEVGRTASIGAAVGAVLAGAGVALAGLVAGPFTLVAAGPVLAALEAAYVGGATGFAFGALMSIDLAEPEADFHAAHIHDGVVWVGVQANGARAERARQILTEAGAKHFMNHRPDVVGAKS